MLVIVITLAAAELNGVHQQAAFEESKLASLVADVAEKKRTYLDLKERQRNERASYSAPEAIASSYAVQQAYHAYTAAEQRLEDHEGLVAQLRDGQSRRAIGLIPYLLAVLIHVLAAAAIWPYRRSVNDAGG